MTHEDTSMAIGLLTLAFVVAFMFGFEWRKLAILAALILGLALATACDLPTVDSYTTSNSLVCHGPDGTLGCPCRKPDNRCSGSVCGPAGVCVPV